MKKTFIGALLAIFILNIGFSVIYGAPKPVKADARRVIGRTAAVIVTAQRFASKGQKYEGLGLAVAHQVYARELFAQDFYSEAIYHSLRARVIAARVVSQNKNGLLNEALYDRQEEKYARETPSDRELDQKLKEQKVAVMNDQAAAGSDVQLDVE